MENKRQAVASSFDHLLGPKDSTLHHPPQMGYLSPFFHIHQRCVPDGRDSGIMENHGGRGKYANRDNVTQKAKGESSGKGKSSVFQNETPEPCYLSSSIYYGGQENYSPRTKNSEYQHVFEKDGGKEDPSGNDPNSASRGNWWQGIMTMSSLNTDYGAMKLVEISED
ncbi:GATA zinc finger domain-containing protein [Salix suchowensis]|nr:GATA zinc finger domain-containing protein [Salix suchowensis]